MRLPKDHPAHIQAAKIAGPDDAPANEPKKKEEPGKAAKNATAPAQPGQPVKKDQTSQGKSDKEKETSAPGEKGQEQGPPPEQKLGGSELKSTAEKSQEKSKGWLGKWGDKFGAEIKEIGSTIKNFFDEDEAHAAHEGHDPHSSTRKNMGEKAKDFISKLPANIIKHATKIAKEKYHQLKNTGRGIKSLALSTMHTGKPQFGWFKDKDGQWKHSKHEAERQKKACISTIKDVGITAAAVVTGGVIGGVVKHVASHGIGGVVGAAAHGGIGTISQGVGGFLHHMAVDFGKHVAKESLVLSAGAGHGTAAIAAHGHGLYAAGAAALSGGALHEILNENEEGSVEQNTSMYTELLKQTLEKIQTFEPNPKQYLEMLKSYAAKKQKDNLEKLVGPLNENISESKQNSINHFVEYATKRLKLKETPNVNLISGTEFAEVKTSLGGYNPDDKSIYVATEGRLTADILRTLAHEMVHRKQDEMGLVRDIAKDGADGSPIENQAHAVAGILMREYGRINKQIYQEAFTAYNHIPVSKADKDFTNNHKSDIGIPATDDTIDFDGEGGYQKVEDINVDVDKGDTVLMGKFKNKKVVVKDFGKDDHGMPTINGKVATTFRMGDKGQNVFKKDENVNEMGSNDIHFKNIVKYYDKGGPNIKKQVSLVIAGSKNANRDRIVGDLRNMGYTEIRGIEKKLGIEDLFEKKNLSEVAQNMQASGTPDGGYVPKGKTRKLDGQDGINKSEEWYTNGGYTQTDFPKADAIFGDDEAEERTIKYSIKNLPDVEYVETDFLKEGLLLEGGAYGHMSHPFDDMDLTFGDLKNIITKALNGDLGVVREKTDGQALAISWKNGRLIAARNKSHLANGGAGAMGIEDVASKFGGRGGLTDAYNFAMKDLSAAIQSLSEAQRKKIFNEGKCFMNLEVIWPTSVNVIPYGQALLVFHNTTCYDEKGTATGADGGAASTLAGMIKQVNADVQSKYTIQGPPITSIPKSDDLSSKQGKYISKLKKLQSEFGLNDTDTVALYHQSYWENFIDKNSPVKVDKLTKEALVRRWAFGDKSLRLNTISNPKLQAWAIQNDKVNVAKQQKENIKPFEEIFLGVGADVLEFVSSVLTVHPEKAIRSMKEKFKSVANQVRGSGDISKIGKLKSELERLNALGGIDKIVATEGLVFFYGGKTYKLTGTFAPLNQILGIFYS